MKAVGSSASRTESFISLGSRPMSRPNIGTKALKNSE